MVIAFPYTGSLTFLVFFAWIPLLLVENDIAQHRYRSRKLFLYSYITFIIFNVGTTYWVAYASLGGAYMAFTLNALFMTLAFQLFHYSKKHLGKKIGYLSLILIWIGFEHAHFYWELSWPWLTIGNYFSITPKLVQWYNITGVEGGSLWVLGVNILGFLFLINFLKYRDKKAQYSKLGIGLVASLILPLTASLVVYYSYEEKNNPYEVVAIQPNIDPYNEKFVKPFEEQITKMMDLGVNKSTPETQLILAPETAIGQGIIEDKLPDEDFYKYILSRLEPLKGNLLIGAISYKNFIKRNSIASRPDGQGGFYEVYNTSVLIDKTVFPQFVHKSKLVLGVEKVPFTDWFPFLEQMSIDQGGASGTMGSEKEPQIYNNQGISIAPVICYESIYGEFCAAQCKKGASLICVMTNDGWWQDTPGYKQHMSFSRLRAIENRRCVARSANTGISCFINQTGDVLQQTEWWKPKAIRAQLNLNSEKTIYSMTGDLLGMICFYLGLAIIILVVITMIKNGSLFKNPFSFEGRIRRTEYGISIIFFVIGRVVSEVISIEILGNEQNIQSVNTISFISLIPLLWFLWAQGSKRCHDVGISGWWQIVPFVPIYLIFGGGEKGPNRFGNDPKKDLDSKMIFKK
jgi:apolipoprotein N-acyltransferase